MVIGGMDTHTAVALVDHGRLLAIATLAATGEGQSALRAGLIFFGEVVAVGVEDTGPPARG